MNRIQKFYNENTEFEWDRLVRHRMEFEVSMLVLKEYLPKPPRTVLDVGGGPSRYSIALAKKGYDVTLVDISKNCLDFANDKANEAAVELAGYIHIRLSV